MRKQTKNLKAIYQETEVEIETLLWHSRKDWALKDGHISLFMTKSWSSNQEIFCKSKQNNKSCEAETQMFL
jgi:hypothetical protein